MSSGKVMTSATQAATPAEASLTAMVGCTSEAVGLTILTQVAELGAGAGEKGCSPKVTVLPVPLLLSSAAANPDSVLWEAVRRQRGGKSARVGSNRAAAPSPPTLVRGALTAPRWQLRALCLQRGTYVAGAQGERAARQVSKDPGMGPAGACPGLWAPPTRILAGAWGAALHPESNQFVPGGLCPALGASGRAHCSPAGTPVPRPLSPSG